MIRDVKAIAAALFVLLYLASLAAGQQLLDDNLVEAYRRVFPKTDEPMLQEVLDRGVLYRNSEMPQPSFRFASARRFPWDTSLGGKSHFGDATHVRTAKLILADRPVAMFGRNNEHQCFANETRLAEIGWMVDDGGHWYPFESRIRMREPDDWQTEIVEPFPTRDKLVAEVAKTHPEIAKQIPKMPIRRFRIRATQPRPSFDETVALQLLPEFPHELKVRLLTSVTHESSAGVDYADDCDGFYQRDSDFHIRPKVDVSAANGNGERESCRNCHRDIKFAASQFGINEPWDIRGGDGIFSFRGITAGGQLRPELVRLGLVVRYADLPASERKYYTRSGFLEAEMRR